MTANPESVVERVTFGKKETATHVLTADNLSVRDTNDGGLVLELFRYGVNDRALESYRFTLCPEDADRVRHSKGCK